MKDFEFTIPQNIIFGEAAMEKLPEILKKENKNKLLLISDRGIEATGLVGRLRELLERNHIACSVYLDVKPNPTVKMCEEAAQVLKDSKAELILAVGGGSPMDVAKAVAVTAVHGGSIIDYEGSQKVPGEILPLIAIPTTAGTGSEVTAFSVIVDEERHYKLTVFDYHLIPRYALLDASVLKTAPAFVAAACGIDAFIHACEAYLSRFATPFSDAMAEKAMELIGNHIRNFVACRENTEAASAMAIASNFAGIAFSWARLGNVHAMSHPVSAYFNVPHGVANAILLPAILEYNALADYDGRYEKIYHYIRGEGQRRDGAEFDPRMLAEEIRKLNADLHIPPNLSAVGVTEDKIPTMARDAMKSGNIQANPRTTGLADVEMLYKRAL